MLFSKVLNFILMLSSGILHALTMGAIQVFQFLFVFLDDLLEFLLMLCSCIFQVLGVFNAGGINIALIFLREGLNIAFMLRCYISKFGFVSHYRISSIRCIFVSERSKLLLVFGSHLLMVLVMFLVCILDDRPQGFELLLIGISRVPELMLKFASFVLQCLTIRFHCC